MPRWPAWVLLGAGVACAYPAVTTPPPQAEPAQDESYQARGNEPGWVLNIHDGRIDYAGDYGDRKVSVTRPEPRPSFNGRRYITPHLTVDITYSRCNDAMSGQGYEHKVLVSDRGRTVSGCGGRRRPDWDM